MKKILFITDNVFLFNGIKEITAPLSKDKYSFTIKKSPPTPEMPELESIVVKKEYQDILDEFDLVISLHCKQLFPKELAAGVRCINVHPGYNPFNRGWYPQVFSIINGLQAGVTVHEIDEHLDHGPIIYQTKTKIEKWDTSLTAYNKNINEELNLLGEHLVDLIEHNYETFIPEKGNINLKKDFNNLLELDLQNKDTLENHINLLRALTHGHYKNAYFIDEDRNKVFISVELEKVD